jgi:hypothetical protein
LSDVFKWALVGDLQIPYEDARAVALWFKVMKWWKPDAIDFVGDIDDQLEYSRFSDGTTDEAFSLLKKEEDPSPLPFIKKNAAGARAFYEKVRKQHPDSDLHLSMGNHDIRVFKYIDKKAPGYNDLVTPNMLWGVDDLGISYKYYEEKPHQRFAGVHVHHGSTLSSTTSTTIRNDLENYGISLVRGHSHRAAVVFKHYPLSGLKLFGMETGHMCNPDGYGLQYTYNPDWQQGFGIAYVVGETVSMHYIPISSDYTCVVDGKLFQG